MCENAYLSIKNLKASRALKLALDPGRRMLTSLARLRFAMSATFGLRSWAPPPLTESWIRTWNCKPTAIKLYNTIRYLCPNFCAQLLYLRVATSDCFYITFTHAPDCPTVSCSKFPLLHSLPNPP